MKKILLPLFACALLGAASCESMLDIPQKGVTSYDDFYASDADAEAALTNMYKQYINNDTTMLSTNTSVCSRLPHNNHPQITKANPRANEAQDRIFFIYLYIL